MGDAACRLARMVSTPGLVASDRYSPMMPATSGDAELVPA